MRPMRLLPSMTTGISTEKPDRAAAFSALGGAPSLQMHKRRWAGTIRMMCQRFQWNVGPRGKSARGEENVATGNTQTLPADSLWRNTYGVKVELPTPSLQSLSAVL